ncbi:TetR/AcrR family transcriptional regulator [Nocardioides limicola]|uniref:TetR/AcrR family transcriptional regulator n=1 Tax=Nocardioides limicola TaxID=2803368 RepID=UPI00193C7874|nr:TetR/AcrR family transcriptional regulator [Nocardioides sp. DJM-14]
MTTRPYRGVPADERRTARREQFLEAGLELFGTRGPAGTRLDDLCAEAGLTKRYFYESFASMDDLLEAVFDQAIADLAEACLPAIAAGGWRNPGPALDIITRRIVADPRLVHLLLIETQAPPLLTKRRQLLDLAVDTWLGVDPHVEKDPRFIAEQRFLAHAMAGAWGETVAAWTTGRIEFSVDDLVGQLVRIFERITPRRRYSAGESAEPRS